MRKLYIIFASLCSLVAFVACEKNQPLDPDGEGWGDQEEIYIPGGNGAIFFDVRSKTKGVLLNTFPTGEPFNVLGYRYNGDWDVVKQGESSQVSTVTYTDAEGNIATQPKGVFYDSDTNTSGVQEVGWVETAYVYSPLKQWVPSLVYSFFAWYPADCATVNGPGVDGDPYLTYDLPLPTEGAANDVSAATARGNMVDLLSACKINHRKVDGMSVPLQMTHRLSALEMKASSLVSAKDLREVYGTLYTEWSSLADDAPVTLNITGFALNFNKIATKVKIPLNTRSSSFDYSVLSWKENVKFFNNYSVGEEGHNVSSAAQTFIKSDDILILIPQTESITASGTIGYTISCGGFTASFEDHAETMIPNLSPGGFYRLLFTISKSGLVVKVEKAPSWDSLVEVDHDFQ
ncbi:MAG: hypothetical protein II205_02375 [Bacteroidales bacterium]|nr:hypothetical protein [Bacteroidales bacterium]